MLSRETLEFPGQSDEHFFTVLRYVERNALRAGVVERAEDWRWSGLWRRVRGTPEQRALLSDGPPKLPKDWLRYVNRPNSEAELAAWRRSVQRGNRTATVDGCKRRPGAWAWNRRSTTAAAPGDVNNPRPKKFAV